MKWQILQYGIRNSRSKVRGKRWLADMCIRFSRWDTGRLVKRLNRKAIPLPAPRYSAQELLKKASCMDAGTELKA